MRVFRIRRALAFLRFGICLASITPALCALPCSAQEDSDSADEEIVDSDTAPEPEISQEKLSLALSYAGQEMMNFYGIDSSSKEAEFFKKVGLNKEYDDTPPLSPGDNPPIAHYRFKGGEPLPSDEAIKKEQLKGELMVAPLKAEAIKESVEMLLSKTPPTPLALPTREPAKLIVKPQCESSETSEFSIPENYVADGVPVDMLFFNGKPPFDVTTTIGQNTWLVTFDDPASSEINSPYGALPIDCVPFRLRSNGSKVTYSKGADALKNYDANPEADGTFDPTIRKYIEQNKLGG